MRICVSLIKSAILATAVVMLLLASAALAQEEKAKEHFNAGVDAEKSGDQAKAIESYRAAITADPNYVNPRLNLGVIYYSQKKYKDAVEQFKKVTELDNSSLDGWKNLGLAATETGEVAIGENAFNKALALKPGDPELMEALAMLYYKNSVYDKAIQKLDELVKLKSQDKTVFYALGKSHKELGNTDKAIDNLNSATKIDAKYHMAYFELGNIYLDQKSWSKAMSNYRKSTEYNPKHYQSWFNLGSACMGESTPESAVEGYHAYNNFMKLTAGSSNKQVLGMRKQAQDIITQLKDFFDQNGIEY